MAAKFHKIERSALLDTVCVTVAQVVDVRLLGFNIACGLLI